MEVKYGNNGCDTEDIADMKEMKGDALLAPRKKFKEGYPEDSTSKKIIYMNYCNVIIHY